MNKTVLFNLYLAFTTVAQVHASWGYQCSSYPGTMYGGKYYVGPNDTYDISKDPTFNKPSTPMPTSYKSPAQIKQEAEEERQEEAVKLKYIEFDEMQNKQRNVLATLDQKISLLKALLAQEQQNISLP